MSMNLSPTTMYVVAAVMLALAALFIWFVLKENERFFPKDAFQWVASGMALVLAGIAVTLAVVTFRVDSGLMPVTRDGTPRIMSTEINAPAPDFAFRMVSDDSEVRLADFAGDVILINFWATWCPPCLEELPALNRLQERYRSQGLTVLTISDERSETLRRFERDLPLLTVSGYLPNPSALPQPFRRTLASRPTTYVIDRDGVIRNFFLGAKTFAAFEQTIRPYLDAPTAEVSLP
jgi:cytochrome c biogenesis protein CcmG, thiol:disulfide interchange protein DsbE